MDQLGVAAGVSNLLLVIIGVPDADADAVYRALSQLTDGYASINSENSLIRGGALVSKQETASLLSYLAGKLNGARLLGKKLHAMPLARYMALDKMGAPPSKTKIKRIAGRREISQWRAGARGEQFLVYNEGALSNYQLDKIFPCAQTSSRAMAGCRLETSGEFIFVTRQKTLLVYGGSLEVLDGFFVDELVKCYAVGSCVVIGAKQERPKAMAWEIWNVFTKELVRRIELAEEEELMVSKGLTHYVIKRGDCTTLAPFAPEAGNLPDGLLTENTRSFVSGLDNVALLVSSSPPSTKVSLVDLGSGAVLRTKVLANIDDYKVEFSRGRVALINTRTISAKPHHFLEIWDFAKDTVVSKALGENVRDLRVGAEVVAVVGNSGHLRVFKISEGKMVETGEIKAHFQLVEAHDRVVAAFDSEALFLIDEDARVMKKLEMDGVTRMLWSPFGLYLALVEKGSVKVVDLCGNVAFSGLLGDAGAFMWRTVVDRDPGIELSKADVERLKAEDAHRRELVKKQSVSISGQQAGEWRDFLQRKLEVYRSFGN